MARLKYLLMRVISMDYRKMLGTIKKISKKSGRNRIVILADIILCGLRYGAGYTDYSLFEFYDKNAYERASYLTRGKSNEIIKRYNSKEKSVNIENKALFNAAFGMFLGREWIDIAAEGKEQALDWIEGHKLFFAKTPGGKCGDGIKKLRAEEYGGAEELYRCLTQSGHTVLEEALTQHGKLSELYPYSVNTIRIMTLLKDGKVNLLGAFLRMGNGKSVDNLNSGGLAAPVGLRDGAVAYPAADKDGNVYQFHPLTGVKINGFLIPMWDLCIETAEKAALIEPEVRYVGWDIGVTPEGPVIIEGNAFPGYDICQLPAHTPDKTGMMPLIDSIENTGVNPVSQPI